MFAGSERAGKRAAAIQSLFATAKRNHLDPHAWLKDVLEKLPTWPNRHIDELLPFAGYRFGKHVLLALDRWGGWMLTKQQRRVLFKRRW